MSCTDVLDLQQKAQWIDSIIPELWEDKETLAKYIYRLRLIILWEVNELLIFPINKNCYGKVT